MMQRTIFSTLLLALTAGLAACTATVPATPVAAPAKAATTPEEIVAEKSQAYWKARIARDVEAAYAMTPPSYRAVHSLENFRLKHGAPPAFGQQTIASVQCEQERCKVTSTFQAFIPMAPRANVSVPKSDTWLQEDGQWWIFVE